MRGGGTVSGKDHTCERVVVLSVEKITCERVVVLSVQRITHVREGGGEWAWRAPAVHTLRCYPTRTYVPHSGSEVL